MFLKNPKSPELSFLVDGPGMGVVAGVGSSVTERTPEDGPLNIGTFSGGISPYGVHDMAGNVSEWVSDWYTPYTDQPTLIRNPQGADSGTMKVHRGGSWSVSSIFARTAYRARENPERGSPYIGIRCVKTSK